MGAYWLTYKEFGSSAPKGMPIETIRDLARRFRADPHTATEWWRLAAHRSAGLHDRVYLFKQGGDPRGIFGVGSIIAGPTKIDVDTCEQKGRTRALVRFIQLVDPTERFLLRIDEIEDIVPQNTITAQASGTRVPSHISAEIDRRLGL